MYQTLERKLQLIIAEAIFKLFDFNLNPDEIIIEIPREKAFGDYATNIAMRLAKDLRNKPLLIAQDLVSSLEKDSDTFFKIEIAGPGFINMFLNPELIVAVLPAVLKEAADFGKTNFGQNEKINLEYVSANPTGDLHPGHARGAAMGDAVARIMKKAGFDITREYYINDAGNQIENMTQSVYVRYLESYDIAAKMPEDGYYGSDIIEIALELKALYGDKYLNQTDLSDIREFALKKQLKKLEADLSQFQVEFDVWSSESEIYQRGLVEKIVEKLNELNLTYQAEGALWLKTSEYGDDKDRVLIKNDGTYTYLTPDIAYHLDKFQRGFSRLVDFWGADHHGYIPRMKAALRALGYDESALSVDIIQMVRMIKDGEEFKLSKRSGKAISLRDLIDEVGVDAIRYFFVSRAADSQMDFDLDLALQQSNENPVYYAQYAHARMASILRQVVDFKPQEQFKLLKHQKELELLKGLNELPLVVNEAAMHREPHKVCNYIQKIAALFHSFYGECKVLDDENPELTQERLGLVLATKITLANALNLIGVSAPDWM